MTDTLAAGSIRTSVYITPHPTPDLDPLPALLAVINGAKQTLHFSAYSFTLAPIADAIIAAHQRGVVVRGVADRTQTLGTSQIPRIAAAGIDVRTWGTQYLLEHEKSVITDWQTTHATVALGSMNWTSAGTKTNTEVMLVCAGAQVARILAPTLVTQLETVYAKAKAA